MWCSWDADFARSGAWNGIVRLHRHQAAWGRFGLDNNAIHLSAALRAPSHCPLGMYVIPSFETISMWHGVLFLHHGVLVYLQDEARQSEDILLLKGPYKGSVLRFTLRFPLSYPKHPPTLRFDSDVFHREPILSSSLPRIKNHCLLLIRTFLAMVDPRTKVWRPRARLAQWQWVWRSLQPLAWEESWHPERPGSQHIVYLLHSLKNSFSSQALASITEEEAVNKQIWS